jgi:general secretion pathway protein G
MRTGKQAGFTLIELLVTLVILGLLVGLVGPQFFGKVDSSKVKTSQIQVSKLKVALQTYRLDMGNYPDALIKLWQRPADANAYWSGPYIDGQVPLDNWGREYQYQVDSKSDIGFSLYSFGADGVSGGEGLNADIGYLPRQGLSGSQENLQ